MAVRQRFTQRLLLNQTMVAYPPLRQLLAQPKASPDILFGLVGLWHFDEDTGLTAYDSSGNGNNGTLEGSPTPSWVPGKYGSALSFNGSNYVNVPYAGSLEPNALTISAWIFPTSSAGSSVISNGDNFGEDICSILYNFGNSSQSAGPSNMHPAFIISYQSGMFFWNAAVLDSGQAIPLNQWTHLAATYDGTTMCIYINGVLAASQFCGQQIAWANDPLLIGGSTMDPYMIGIIDEVRFYNRALQATDIAKLYWNSLWKILLSSRLLVNQSMKVVNP